MFDPWKSFEEFLKKDTTSNCCCRSRAEMSRENNCCMESEYTLTVKYDPAFNAFIVRHIVESVLPYWNQLDHVLAMGCCEVSIVVVNVCG